MTDGEINYAGGQTIYNKQKIESRLTAVTQPIAQSVTAEATRAKGVENTLSSTISAVSTALDTEKATRQSEDNKLSNKIGELNNLQTSAKTNIVAAVNELKSAIPSQQIIDDRLNSSSSNAVQNKAIVSGITAAVTPIESRVDALEQHLPLDTVPTKDSEKGVVSGGTFDAIRFASVRVGETMFWPVSDNETREVHSDNPFNFTYNGQMYSVTTQDGYVETCISKNVPDGWHALDGKAELDAAQYTDLAAFMPDNVTTDGKIWLPYVQQKIIKVKY